MYAHVYVYLYFYVNVNECNCICTSMCTCRHAYHSYSLIILCFSSGRQPGSNCLDSCVNDPALPARRILPVTQSWPTTTNSPGDGPHASCWFKRWQGGVLCVPFFCDGGAEEPPAKRLRPPVSTVDASAKARGWEEVLEVSIGVAHPGPMFILGF